MEFDPQSLLPLAIAAVMLAGMRYLPRLMAGVPFEGPRELKDLLDSGKEVLVLDIRTAGEFTGPLGHVAGAVNLPVGELDGRLRDQESGLAAYKDEAIFVTCRTENRSPRAVKALKRAGFTNISVLKGGMRGWNRAGLPVEGKG